MVTESKYKWQVPLEELNNPACVRDYSGAKKKELEIAMEKLDGLSVKFALVEGKIFIEGRALND